MRFLEFFIFLGLILSVGTKLEIAANRYIRSLHTTNDSGNAKKISTDDFEMLVFNFLSSIVKNKNKEMLWYNFYDPKCKKMDKRSLRKLKPTPENPVRVPIETQLFKKLQSATVVNISQIRNSIIRNDNSFNAEYKLAISFNYSYIEAFPTTYMKPSMWFENSSDEKIWMMYEWNSDFTKRIVGSINSTASGYYSAKLAPNETFKIEWNLLTRKISYRWKLIVKFYGYIVIAFEDEILLYPLTKLAKDRFYSYEKALAYDYVEDFNFTYGSIIIANAYSLMHPLPIELPDNIVISKIDEI